MLMVFGSSVFAQSKNKQSARLEFAPGEYEAFRKAARPVIKDIDECEDTYKVGDGTATLVDLGKGAHAVLFHMTGACICGATGNCPILLFTKARRKYQAQVKE